MEGGTALLRFVGDVETAAVLTAVLLPACVVGKDVCVVVLLLWLTDGVLLPPFFVVDKGTCVGVEAPFLVVLIFPFFVVVEVC